MTSRKQDEPSRQLPDPRALLRRYGIRPRKGLGQHFLVDRRYLGRIIRAADLSSDDVVIEIGPGLGVLTVALAEEARTVIAVEVDADMRTVLADLLPDHANVRVVAANILETSTAELTRRDLQATPGRNRGLKIVANLPYYITSAVLRHLLQSPVKPESMVVMVQREVAERITAAPGDMSLLALSVQLYASARRIAAVPREAFYPRPKVDSEVVHLGVREQLPVEMPSGGEATLFRVMKAGFAQKRKQLRNSVAAGLAIDRETCAAALQTVHIDPRRRAQTLSLGEWSALTRELDQRGLL